MSSAVLQPPSKTTYYAEGTFLPGDSSRSLDALLDDAWHMRFTKFMLVYAELFALCPEDCEASGFLPAASDLINTTDGYRRELINHPVFRIWLGMAMRDLNGRLSGRIDDPQPLRSRLDEFAVMLDRVRVAAKTPAHPGFHRMDVDPLIASMLPPSYVVPDDPAERKAKSQIGHPLSFITDVARIALDRIQATWPDARRHFEKLVSDVCYLPDGNFRSCSASRYTGIILISNRDGSVLDMEESLVHEAGHQLLYHIVEIHPVSDDDVKDQYRLPWSGQFRDFYGYFHAFYIYVILAQYHERVMEQRSGRDRDAARVRVRDILRGLIAALPDFQGNPHLTPEGSALIEAVAIDVHKLHERQRDLLAA